MRDDYDFPGSSRNLYAKRLESNHPAPAGQPSLERRGIGQSAPARPTLPLSRGSGAKRRGGFGRSRDLDP